MDGKAAIGILIWSILGFLTLLPVSTASKTNLIGYYSLFTFVPISTIILFLIAGNIYFDAEIKVNRENDSGNRIQ